MAMLMREDVGGKWLNGVGKGSRWEGTFPGYSGPTGGSCDVWTEYGNFSATTKKQLYQFAQSSMDALTHWFFWTWKIGNRYVVVARTANEVVF